MMKMKIVCQSQKKIQPQRIMAVYLLKHILQRQADKTSVVIWLATIFFSMQMECSFKVRI